MTDSPLGSNGRFAHWAAIAIVAVAVGSYYLWEVRASGYSFDWARENNGYYNYLGRAFAHGHLALAIEPSAQLLAAANPWDPALDDSYKMQDMAFFNRRYYLYHGPGPAVLLFTPWLLISGHDLPERFALFMLCFGGFVFSCGVLIRWLALAGVKTGPALLAAMLLALGLCQSAPYLLSRVWVYEIAIAGGYFCVSAAMFCLAMGIDSGRSRYWLGASGLLFGMAIACRPHLGLAGVIAMAGLVVLLPRSRSLTSILTSPELIAFTSAFAIAGGTVALYNYQRFGNPFEFGLRYLLAGLNQNRIRLAGENILPGLSCWFTCAPEFGPVFPWVRPAFRNYDFPPEYFYEATVGLLYLAPFAAAALFVSSTLTDVRILLWTALISSTAILLFLAATGFTTQRYEVDFLPLLVLVAIANFGIHAGRSSGLRRALISGMLLLSIACGAVVNMALGITGPYGEILKNRPADYVRLARWLSPIEQFRPMMNPSVNITFTTEFASRKDEMREPLVTIGRQSYGHFLYAEHSAGKLRLVSRSVNSTITHELAEGDRRAEIRVNYSPESGALTTMWNGQVVMAHDIGTLITAPAEITIGENRVDAEVTTAQFTGRIYNIVKTVSAATH